MHKYSLPEPKDPLYLANQLNIRVELSVESLLSIFKALADKNRLRIIASLQRQDELCACQIIEMLGVAGATASKHLAVLQDSGMISSRKEGRWNYFRLSNNLPQEFPEEWLKKTLNSLPEIVKDERHLEIILQESPVDICRRQRGE